jgi:ubiquinone biosynthesis monooxygenase Coq7
MRVNHVGEICAQALYQGQALTARSNEIRLALANAAREEVDHLAWTAQRLTELGAHRSMLAPIWYVCSLAMGAAAGLCGDLWSLGFLAETERQVEAHLEDHLSRLPVADTKSRAIVRQMKSDERAHADLATSLGGLNLPNHVRLSMRLAAQAMKGVAYRL